ncbi:MAG: preprotein translocase subunit SecE [Candidatus Nanopelagicales bacterium]|nr:preprotein translocase subunit SecE [Candidatus Nanopelagicales bacterium]
MTDTDGTVERSSAPAARAKRNLFSRTALFVRQVIAELRKVIWPTRKELIAYTTVVLVFVLFMAGIVAGLDYIFTKGVLFIFG